MGRAPAHQQWPPELRHELDRLLGEGKLTIDEIVAHMRQLGAPDSRSAIGRAHKRFEEIAQRMNQAREMSKSLADRIAKDPDGDTGKTIIGVLESLLLDASIEWSGVDDNGTPLVMTDPKALPALTLAIQRLGAARMRDHQREELVRKRAAEKAAQAACEVAAKRGVSAETMRAMREEIMRG